MVIFKIEHSIDLAYVQLEVDYWSNAALIVASLSMKDGPPCQNYWSITFHPHRYKIVVGKKIEEEYIIQFDQPFPPNFKEIVQMQQELINSHQSDYFDISRYL